MARKLIGQPAHSMLRSGIEQFGVRVAMPGYHRLRLPDRYSALLDLSASGFAWEWLRRNADFRTLWVDAGEDARIASARAQTASSRVSHSLISLPRHPLEGRTAHWGLTFLAFA